MTEAVSPGLCDFRQKRNETNDLSCCGLPDSPPPPDFDRLPMPFASIVFPGSAPSQPLDHAQIASNFDHPFPSPALDNAQVRQETSRFDTPQRSTPGASGSLYSAIRDEAEVNGWLR
jgi:hypothetical protein